MNPAPLGLTTYRWNNNFKSFILLASFPFLLLGMIAAFFGGVGYSLARPDGLISPIHTVFVGGLPDAAPISILTFLKTGTRTAMPFVFGIAAIWIFVGCLFNDGCMKLMTGGKGISRTENPELYNLLENLCISRGMRMPKLQVMDTPVLNAFASGLSEGSYAITLTQGLIKKLNKDQLEAVIAHELTHIANHDCRLLVVIVLFGGMLAFFADMAWRNLSRGGFFFSNSGRKNGGINIMLIFAVVLSIGYVFSILFQLALSRRREYIADAGAVELTKRPESMIGALEHVSKQSELPGIPQGVQAMLIDSPPSYLGLFSTHPPIEARISVLRRMGGLLSKRESPIPRST